MFNYLKFTSGSCVTGFLHSLVRFFWFVSSARKLCFLFCVLCSFIICPTPHWIFKSCFIKAFIIQSVFHLSPSVDFARWHCCLPVCLSLFLSEAMTSPNRLLWSLLWSLLPVFWLFQICSQELPCIRLFSPPVIFSSYHCALPSSVFCAWSLYSLHLCRLWVYLCFTPVFMSHI